MKNIINWQSNDCGLMFYKRAHERMKEMGKLQINNLDNNDVSKRRNVIASLLTLPLLDGRYAQYCDLGSLPDDRTHAFAANQPICRLAA